MNIINNIREKRATITKEEVAQDNSFKANVIRIIKGSLFSIIISILFLFIFAVLLTYTNISENSITPVVLAIVGLSILFGSYLSTRKINKKGIVNGAIVSIVYMLILYLISSILLMDFSLGANSLIMIGCGIIAGIIGGIIGVNSNR